MALLGRGAAQQDALGHPVHAVSTVIEAVPAVDREQLAQQRLALDRVGALPQAPLEPFGALVGDLGDLALLVPNALVPGLDRLDDRDEYGARVLDGALGEVAGPQLDDGPELTLGRSGGTPGKGHGSQDLADLPGDDAGVQAPPFTGEGQQGELPQRWGVVREPLDKGHELIAVQPVQARGEGTWRWVWIHRARGGGAGGDLVAHPCAPRRLRHIRH